MSKPEVVWRHDIEILERTSYLPSMTVTCSCGWNGEVVGLILAEVRGRVMDAIKGHKLDMLMAASHLEFTTHEKKE